MGLEPLDEHVLTEQEVPQITTYLSITKGNKLISSRERGTNRWNVYTCFGSNKTFITKRFIQLLK